MLNQFLVYIEFFIGISFAYDKVFFGVGLSMLVLTQILRARFGHSHKHWTFGSNRLEKIMLVGGLIFGLAGAGLKYYYQSRPAPAQTIWGVTFSQLMSKQLGLDWRANYEAIVNDLHPDGIRLIAYWNHIEPKENEWDFADLDWQMSEAQSSSIPVILALGQKAPRWPECHFPSWLDTKDAIKRKESLLVYLKAVVLRYQNSPNLNAWQVENEPLFTFGECPPYDEKLLSDEIALVKSIDPIHPVLLTDSGELGNWYQVARLGDEVGTTLYRDVYNGKLARHITYPLSPEFYSLKESVAKILANKSQQKFIVAELDAEPWGQKQIYEMTTENQMKLFGLDNLKNIVSFAQATKFDAFYFWGVEWWYSLKQQGYPEYWKEAKKLMTSG